MATTPEQDAQDQRDFADAFASDVNRSELPGDDEVFGNKEAEPQTEGEVQAASQGETPEAVEAVDAPAGAQAAEASAEGGASGDPGAAPAMAVVIETDATEDGPTPDGEEPMSDKDKARESSWRGRLEARERELAAREEALKSREQSTQGPAEEGAETPAQEANEGAMGEKLEETVEAVQSGELTVDQAMKTLSEDFGPDFVKMLQVLVDASATAAASKVADEKVGGLSKTIDGIVDQYVGDKAQNHYESISDAHPDFMEVAESEDFKGWVDAMPEEDKAKALKVIGGGTARQIVRLISAFKEISKKPAEQEDTGAMDAAESPRSGGALQIPDKPTQSQDYEEAWSKF